VRLILRRLNAFVGEVKVLGILSLSLIPIGNITSERLGLFRKIFLWQEEV
jgi:hypothetical protein